MIPPPPSPRLSGLVVLVADDHPGNRELVAQLLMFEGASRVDRVATGLAAIDSWLHARYDLLLLDWHMPGLDGLEVLRRIREIEREQLRPRTAILMVTGRISDSDLAVCLAAGADACVPKPYTPDELLDAANNVIK